MELPGWLIGYLYGWWPYVPLTLVIGLIAAGLAVWFVRELALEYDQETGAWTKKAPWWWWATILGAILGFLLWPLAIVIVIIMLIFGAAISSDDEDG